ncbi:MAG: DMT family transporter [Anaerobutyricum sp.]|nr:DMT family transporter [Eubacterium sp.]MDY6047576.1 DMT family transporter [Anaerobutyricum sp.]
MFGMIAALVSGALMSIQGVFNTQVTEKTGSWITNTFVQLTGFLVCLCIWFIKERNMTSFSNLMTVEPKYLLTGGILGAFITFTVIMGMSSLGPAKAVMLIVAAQLIVAYLIEVFGWFGVEKVGFDWMKLLGTLLFLAGIVVFKIRG